MNDELRFKDLETWAELQDMQALERTVWSMPSVPRHIVLTTGHNGGFAQGAYHGEQLVGFTYGFPGFRDGKVYFCSHMMGIHPEHRHRGLGRSLKWQQRRKALAMGYSLITWTFDPLETVNAYLNLHHLHAIGARYSPDHYGEQEDGLNDGLPTDRLILEWWIASSYVESVPDWLAELSLADAVPVLGVSQRRDLPVPDHLEPQLAPDQPFVRLPVPGNFQSIKKQDLALARRWRQETGRWFPRLHAAGYQAVDLRRTKDSPVCHYIFARRERVMQAVHQGVDHE